MSELTRGRSFGYVLGLAFLLPKEKNQWRIN